MTTFVSRFTSVVALLLATVLIAAGCTTSREENQATDTPSSQRIVVLGPSLTESVYAIGAGQQVVAVDKLSTFPVNAAKSELDSYSPNVEAIAKYRPDLVLTTDDRNGLVAGLSKFNIRTKVLAAPANLEQTYQQINEIGAITGHSDQAQDLTRRMKDDIDKIVADLPKRNLSYFHDLGGLYSVGPQSFIGNVYSLFGLRNIAETSTRDGNQYPKLAAEFVVKANPDLIFVTSDSGESATSVEARPGWSAITAVRNKHVFTLDGDLASRWGPRVADLVRSIADALGTVK